MVPEVQKLNNKASCNDAEGERRRRRGAGGPEAGVGNGHGEPNGTQYARPSRGSQRTVGVGKGQGDGKDSKEARRR
eukprot:6209924-Pleurochrysis_carterae.AAC.7